MAATRVKGVDLLTKSFVLARGFTRLWWHSDMLQKCSGAITSFCEPNNLHPLCCLSTEGAAPLNWAVINGDTEAGITASFSSMSDTGEIIPWYRIA